MARLKRRYNINPPVKEEERELERYFIPEPQEPRDTWRMKNQVEDNLLEVLDFLKKLGLD